MSRLGASPAELVSGEKGKLFVATFDPLIINDRRARLAGKTRSTRRERTRGLFPFYFLTFPALPLTRSASRTARLSGFTLTRHVK